MTRSKNVSAITWPRERSSNVVSAARFNAAYAPTPLATGKQHRHIGHGVGRRADSHGAVGLGLRRAVDNRLRHRGDRRSPWRRPSIRASPFPSSVADVCAHFGIEAAAVLDVQVLTGLYNQRRPHSESAPHSKLPARRRCGISDGSAFAKPRWRPPRAGRILSRQRHLTGYAATMPVPSATRPRLRLRAAAHKAPPPRAPAPAAAADFSRSSREVSSTSAESFFSRTASQDSRRVH